MSYNLKKDKIFVGNKHRIFFKHKNVANYFCSFLYPIAIFLGFFITFTIVAPALASNTNKLSVLDQKEVRGDFSLTQVKTSPQSKVTSYCYSALQKNPSQQELDKKKAPMKAPALHGRNRAPVALSLYLGVRLALGPTEEAINNAKNKRHVQSSSTQQIRSSSSSRALAIAAYRACEKERNLRAILPRSI